MSFKQFKLDSRLWNGISKAGFKTPTPIQEQAIPAAMAGRDLLATAQTGTGKTAAFVLPILHHLLTHPGKRTRALIVTPTRELAEQIHQTINVLKHGTKIRNISVYGGVNANPQIRGLERKVEIVVATPGRLLDLAQNKHINLRDIEIAVLDEADRMLDMGFLPDIKRILNMASNRKQTMLFSATFPEEIEKLGREFLQQPERVKIGMVAPAHTVNHTLFPVSQHLKKKLLMSLLEATDTNSVLIFTRTKHKAKRLDQQLRRANYRATSLHSNRSQSQRQTALDGFKSGRYQIMVATDIAARGLDIDSISHVINYDMPDTADAYIHRIGRTGRAKRDGEAYTLVTQDDYAMVRKIEKIMKADLPKMVLDGFDYDAPRPDYGDNNNNGNGRRSNNGANNGHKNGQRKNKKSSKGGNGNRSQSNGRAQANGKKGRKKSKGKKQAAYSRN